MNKCFLVAEGGQHILYNSDGKKVDGLMKTVTTDGLPGEEQFCEATVRVHICSKEEMEKIVAETKDGKTPIALPEESIEQMNKIRKWKRDIWGGTPLDTSKNARQ